MNPELLILDEPTSALDVSVQAQIMNLLKDLKEDPGISMIFITHDFGLASDLCVSIAVAYAGQQVEFGPADRVLVEPRHPYTGLLLSSLPRLHDPTPPTPMPGEPPDLSNPPSGCRFHPRCPYAFDPCSKIMPPEYPIDDGGHARCFLNDQYLAGDRYLTHLGIDSRA
jgi:peptide/nickel transport system ATP-binding protein